MKRLLRVPVVTVLCGICLLFGIISAINPKMYDWFSYYSPTRYPWQFFSGAFMHGQKEAPLWFLFVHMGMNFLMVIPFGSVCEKRVGTKKMCFLFFSTWIVSSVACHFLIMNTNEPATGISAIGYAFLTAGTYYMWKERTQRSKHVKVFVVVMASLSVIMLCPLLTGWVSTLLHLSGVLCALLFLLVNEKGTR